MNLRLDTRTLVLIPLAIVINMVAGEIVARIGLPLYLDSIGTVLVGALTGIIPGALTGALTNLIWGLVRPTSAPFAITAAVIGALAGWFARIGWFRRETIGVLLVALAGLITGLVAALVSAPIAAYLFGGVTGASTDALVAFFQSMGANVLQAALGQGLVSDPVDKLVTFVVVWLILAALPRRQLLRFPQGEKLT